MVVFINLLSGAAIGLLIGLLVSLSNAPVVASTTSVLVGGALVFVSLSRDQETRSAANNSKALLRLIGFSISAAAALLLGIYLRAHNSFGQSSSATLYRELIEIGVTPDDAREVVVASISPPPSMQKVAMKSDWQASDTEKLNSTSLFSIELSQTSCEAADPRKFRTFDDAKARLAIEGSYWKRAAYMAESAIAGHPELDAKSLLTGIYISICSKR
jgi:hypothetical protein